MQQLFLDHFIKVLLFLPVLVMCKSKITFSDLQLDFHFHEVGKVKGNLSKSGQQAVCQRLCLCGPKLPAFSDSARI